MDFFLKCQRITWEENDNSYAACFNKRKLYTNYKAHIIVLLDSVFTMFKVGGMWKK